MTTESLWNAPPTTAEADVLAGIAAESMLTRTLAWSAINSGSRNLDGLAAMADVLQPLFGQFGPVARVVPSPAEAVDSSGTCRPLAHGDNLHLVVRPDAPVRVLLTGHMDTVFPADHPFQSSRRVDANTVNGPGVADMKGGIAVMLAALEAVGHVTPNLGFDVVINADEEVSSLGSAALLRAAAVRCHLGLTYEPALPDGTLAGARGGSGNFSAVVRGRAAHAGREPELGRNAIVAAADLIVRLAALGRAGCTVNPAKIDGGGPNNIVPDLAIVRFNVRPATLADQAYAAAAIAGAVAAVAAAHDVSVSLDGGFARPPKPLDATQGRAFDLVRGCGAALGLPIGWRATGGVCDGNNLAATGLAVVDTMGVRGGAIHSVDEFVLIDSFVERARLSALVLLRVAAHGFARDGVA